MVTMTLELTSILIVIPTFVFMMLKHFESKGKNKPNGYTSERY